MSENMIITYYDGDNTEEIVEILKKAQFANNKKEGEKKLVSYLAKGNLILAKNTETKSIEGAYLLNKLNIFGNVGAIHGRGHLAVKNEGKGVGSFMLKSLEDVFSYMIKRNNLKYIDHQVLPTETSAGFFEKNGYFSLPDYDNEGEIRPHTKRFFKPDKKITSPMVYLLGDYIFKRDI